MPESIEKTESGFKITTTRLFAFMICLAMGMGAVISISEIVNMPGFGPRPSDMSHLRTSRVIDFSSSWPDLSFNFQAVLATVLSVILFAGPAIMIVKKLEGQTSNVIEWLLILLPFGGCVLGCSAILFGEANESLLNMAAWIGLSAFICLFISLVVLFLARVFNKLELKMAIVLICYWGVAQICYWWVAVAIDMMVRV